jgi:hypothetical protein
MTLKAARLGVPSLTASPTKPKGRQVPRWPGPGPRAQRKSILTQRSKKVKVTLAQPRGMRGAP